MPLPNIFSKTETDKVIERINQLSPASQAQWGKMNVAQMLAHCSVTYEMVYDNIHPKPNGFVKFLLKMMVKNTVVNEVPYKKNNHTAAQFIIKDEKDFTAEKNRLVEYVAKTQVLGEAHFDGKESHSFGSLKTSEWNNMFYKHINHHLTQFGV